MQFELLVYANIVLGILAGILAAAALIVSKKPDAKALIDKLTPFQALIGVGLIVVSLINFVSMLGEISIMLQFFPLFGTASLAMVISGFLLGALFGMPQIAKWIPGESPAEQKALELSRKVAGYQVVLGIISVVSSLIVLLYVLGILKP